MQSIQSIKYIQYIQSIQFVHSIQYIQYLQSIQYCKNFNAKNFIAQNYSWSIFFKTNVENYFVIDIFTTMLHNIAPLNLVY